MHTMESKDLELSRTPSRLQKVSLKKQSYPSTSFVRLFLSCSSTRISLFYAMNSVFLFGCFAFISGTFYSLVLAYDMEKVSNE